MSALSLLITGICAVAAATIGSIAACVLIVGLVLEKLGLLTEEEHILKPSAMRNLTFASGMGSLGHAYLLFLREGIAGWPVITVVLAAAVMFLALFAATYYRRPAKVAI